MSEYSNIIPTDYNEWRHCITVKCGIKLTEDFVEQRIAELNDKENPTTRQFIKLYGEQHWQLTLNWFEHEKSNR